MPQSTRVLRDIPSRDCGENLFCLHKGQTGSVTESLNSLACSPVGQACPDASLSTQRATMDQQHERRMKNTAKKKKLYVISMAQWCKIGISNNPKRRLTEISTSSPLPPKLECTISSSNAERIEKEIHTELSHLNTNGEWFRIDPWDAVGICENMSDGESSYEDNSISHRELKTNWRPDPTLFSEEEAQRIVFSKSTKGFTKAYCLSKKIPYPQPKGWLSRLRFSLIKHYKL